MIDLSNKDKYKIEVKSSKGNQPKWKIGDFYYKQDYLGYEGLVEYAISQLLKKTNLKKDEFVEYNTEIIQNGNYIRNGCISKNFLQEGQSLVTLYKLYRNNYQRIINQDVFKIENLKERVRYIENRVYDLADIKDFGKYLCKIIEIDAFFLNEDRHFNNIALIYENDKYKLCPIFDNGSSLLSDTTLEYQMDKDVYKLIDNVKPKTFTFNFYEQLETIESLYGQQLEFYFTKKDIEEILNNEPYYKQEDKERIKTILFEQMRKYNYLFKNNHYIM